MSKETLIALKGLLTGIGAEVRPGGQAEIDYKQSLVQLQALIDEPEPNPKTVIQTEVVTADIADQVTEKLQTWIKGIDDSQSYIALHIANLENAVAATVTAGQTAAEKLDALTPVLTQIVTNTTPAPASETTAS